MRSRMILEALDDLREETSGVVKTRQKKQLNEKLEPKKEDKNPWGKKVCIKTTNSCVDMDDLKMYFDANGIEYEVGDNGLLVDEKDASTAEGILADAESECRDDESLKEEVLDEKITNIKDYYNSNKNKSMFQELGVSERDFMKLANIDPTHKENSNEGGTYIEWLIKLLKTKVTTFREMMVAAHEYKDQLGAFDDLKKRKRLPENKRDIMQVKSLQDLVNLVATRGMEEPEKQAGEEGAEEGGEEKKSSGSMSDFKQDLADFPALCKKLTWPDDVTGTYEDHMEFIGENEKWEVWKVKSPLGAFVFDQWGDGAKWCVGGFGYKGDEGKRSAENYYPHYLHGGKGCYVCFQQKNKNEPRPNNKALITFDDESRYKVSQFNHSNNSSYYSGGYSANTADEFARFLKEEGLVDVIKNSEFKNCQSLLDIETMERLEAGEPYKYIGEPVPQKFKTMIREAIVSDDYEGDEIKAFAFNGCENMHKIWLPERITKIGYRAFYNCADDLIIYIKVGARTITGNTKELDFLKKHIKRYQ